MSKHTHKKNESNIPCHQMLNMFCSLGLTYSEILSQKKDQEPNQSNAERGAKKSHRLQEGGREVMFTTSSHSFSLSFTFSA